jgi:hypothetical protein
VSRPGSKMTGLHGCSLYKNTKNQLEPGACSNGLRVRTLLATPGLTN